MQPDWQRFEQEARRVHERYMVEVVEAFGLCPWAKDARLKGKVKLHVTFLARPDPEALLSQVDVCMRDEAAEIGMLICPMLPASRRSFRRLMAEVRAAEQARRAGDKQRIALADFHPNAAADLTTPEKLVPFIRRAPDPMLQIVRMDVLARVRRAQDHGTSYVDPDKLALLALEQLPAPEPPLTARIAQSNLQLVERVGVERVQAIIESIHADRDRAYAACGALAPTRAHIGDISEETVSDSAGNGDEKPGPKARPSCPGDESHTYSLQRKSNDI